MNLLLALFFLEMFRGFSGLVAMVLSPLGLVFVLFPIMVTCLGVKQALQVFRGTMSGQVHLKRAVRMLWIAPFFNALVMVVMLLVIIARIM